MGGPATGIKGVTRTVAAGPYSLTPKIGAALENDPPDWPAIQAQTKEYAELAKTLGTYDPPKRAKPSWKTLTDSFAETAADMEKAAQGNDLTAARTAIRMRWPNPAWPAATTTRRKAPATWGSRRPRRFRRPLSRCSGWWRPGPRS